MAAKDELGRAGENRAVDYLTKRGWQVLDRNWRCAQGEIDIVAATPDRLAIVEVKTRRGLEFGHPFEAVNEKKRQRLWRLTWEWLAAHPEVRQGRPVHLHAIALIGADPVSATLEHLADVR